MNKWTLIIGLAAVTACSSSSAPRSPAPADKSAAAQPAPAAASPATTPAPTAEAPAAAAPTPSQPGASGAAAAPATTATAAPAEPEFRDVTIPAETPLSITLSTPVASDTSKVEDKVTGRLAKPIIVHGRTVVPAGAEVIGSVTAAKESGRVEGLASVSVHFDRLVARGDTHRIETTRITRQAQSTKGKDAKKIGRGAVDARQGSHAPRWHDREHEAPGAAERAGAGRKVIRGPRRLDHLRCLISRTSLPRSLYTSSSAT
jgi:hypothetical protein